MLTIKNEKLIVEVDQKGAQLTHVVDKATGFDYIWNGPEWPKHAPILFPSIGRSADDRYLIDGTSWPMPQHGFANEYDFEIIEHTLDRLVLRLYQNEETLKFYPFNFALWVDFRLKSDKLHVNFEVENPNSDELSFSLGFHPAFNLPGSFESWSLKFDTESTELHQFEIVKTPNPYRSGKVLPFAGKVEETKLSRRIFEKGLVILDNPIKSVDLVGSESQYSLSMELSDFTRLCLWTKEDTELPYLCLEPFYGLPDISGQTQELSSKEGNAKLASHRKGRYDVTLTFRS